jgi:threonylcarbamoyladenosine tRNA methylthiotransferase MtaB
MDPMKHFSITTLGCKVNQCESDALSSLLASDGGLAQPDRTSADIIVINTCAVTGKAAMQSRQAIRQAVRNNPDAMIVVTGCYAQTAPDQIRRIKGVDLIVGHADKLRIAQFIRSRQPQSQSPALRHRAMDHAAAFDAMPSVAPENRTRAFLKIQDGCNTFCTYCIVPYARGRSRSMPVIDVVNHIEKLSVDKFMEVVLTGIHLGVYGRDLRPPTTLAVLLKHISRTTNMPRIRLSSIEPTEIDASVLELMADSQSHLCPHLHIPMQSGDNHILKRMGRPYTREYFSEVIQQAHRYLPQAAIGVDVMVGFPGESDAAFHHSMELIRSLPVTYLHVFPFSPRKGTPAEGFPNRVPDPVIKTRGREMRRLGEEKKMAFLKYQVGRTLPVLIETACDGKTGYAKGLSANYIPVLVPDTQVTENSLVDIRITGVASNAGIIGII